MTTAKAEKIVRKRKSSGKGIKVPTRTTSLLDAIKNAGGDKAFVDVPGYGTDVTQVHRNRLIAVGILLKEVVGAGPAAKTRVKLAPNPPKFYEADARGGKADAPALGTKLVGKPTARPTPEEMKELLTLLDDTEAELRTRLGADLQAAAERLQKAVGAATDRTERKRLTEELLKAENDLDDLDSKVRAEAFATIGNSKPGTIARYIAVLRAE